MSKLIDNIINEKLWEEKQLKNCQNGKICKAYALHMLFITA